MLEAISASAGLILHKQQLFEDMVRGLDLLGESFGLLKNQIAPG